MKKIILATSLLLSVSSLSAFSLHNATDAMTQVATHKKSTSLTSMLTSQLGVTDTQASGGVGSILSYAKSALPKNKYTKLASAIPNASSLISKVSATKSGTKTSQLASLASNFSSLGLSTDMIGKFVPVIMNYFKSSGKSDAMSILAGLFK
jgi:hypothetical protein